MNGPKLSLSYEREAGGEYSNRGPDHSRLRASANMLVPELKPEPSPMQHELVSDPIEMREGWIDVRDAPGLGVTVDEVAVRRYLFE